MARALDRASREERALNDLLVQSGHHERVLALVQNGVVSHDVSPGVPDATPASADQASSISEPPRNRENVRRSRFGAANVATAFSRLRSALRRVPLGGPVNRRREVAAHVVRHDARYAKMREMLRDALRASARSNWRPPSRRSLTSTPSPGTAARPRCARRTTTRPKSTTPSSVFYSRGA